MDESFEVIHSMTEFSVITKTRGVIHMNYDENVFKAKANIKARRIWLVFALLLTANYGSDAAGGLYPANYYLIFVLLCWIPFLREKSFLR